MFYLAENFPVLKVVAVGDHNALNGIDMVQVIHKVPFAKVDGQLTIGRGFLKDFDGCHHSWRCFFPFSYAIVRQ